MTKLFQVGISYPHEMKSGIGHIGMTLAGVNYECRGGKGVLKGSAARGATNKLFKHHFFMLVSDSRAAAAKKWLDACVGTKYQFGGMHNPDKSPKRRGDCSALVSGGVCKVLGKPATRLFYTGNFKARSTKLGFRSGLGGGVITSKKVAAVGVADRPYPGSSVVRNDKRTNHVKWIQARLNHAAKNKHPVLGGKPLDVDGEYGDDTTAVVKAFQRKHGLQGLGVCGPKTWPLLNKIR
jgi:Putative peptidoglycan binding domain